MSRIKQTKKTTKFDPKIDISNERITEFEIKPNKVEEQKNSLQEVISVLSQLSDEQMINGLLFKQVFFTIEAKLTELQDRMDNRDQLQELNSRYVQIKNLSPNNEESSMIRNKSQMSIQVNQDAQSQISSENMKISPQSRSHTKNNLQIREKDSARDYSRMNILEKRIKQIEDKFTKSFKEFQEQQLIAFSKYDKQLSQIIERGNSPYSKKDQPLDLGQKVQELYDSYRILIGHIKDIKGEINELNHSVQKQQEATHHQNVDQIRTIEQITTQQQESIAQIMAIQQNFTSLDADLIEILKSYKDLLNEVYRIDIMQQQLKRLQTYYDSQR